jgi:hypothetical protein
MVSEEKKHEKGENKKDTKLEGKKTTISSRDRVPCGGYHLHCMARHTEHDQIAVGKHSDLDPLYHNPFSNDISGSAELHGW